MTRRLVSRRGVLRGLAAGAAGTAVSTGWAEALMALARDVSHDPAVHAAMTVQDWAPKVLTPRQNDTVIVLTELIIPETDTPGARGALVNRFVDSVLQGAEPAVRESFLTGLAWVDTRSRALFQRDFVDAAPDQQTDLLTRLSAEESPPKEEKIGLDFFRTIKAMTIDGYYTTEIGLRQELGDSGQLFLLQFGGCEHKEHM